MDSVQQNGVSFTPEKVVDLDSYEKNKTSAPADGGAEPEAKSDDVRVDDTNVETKSADAPAESYQEPEQSNDDAKSEHDDIPLNELFIEIDGNDVNASELVDKYSEMKSELDKIKGDEFLNRFIDFYKDGGDPSEFFQKATTKWDKVNDMQLLKMQFDQENTDLDEEAKQLIFERELVSKYGINPDGTYDDEDSRDAKVGKQLMKRDAQKLRNTMMEEQKKFMLPQPKSQQQQQFDPAKIREELLRDKELDGLLKNKSVQVADSFSYDADPDKVIGMMSNTAEFWNLFKKQDGSWDKNAMAKVFAFAMDPKKYDSHILKLGQDLGSESYIKEQRNTVEKGKTRVVDKSTDKDAPLVRGGRVYGNSDDLLKAFISQKR